MAVSQASTNERSLRSVFVGNIPYDASEEKLKDVFSEVGPVLSFKLVYDRESGKPKGYGFCEYRDQETALSAMRNLNGYEMSGRNLRVDTATNERFKEEIKNLQMSSTNTIESSYGQEVDPEKAPEAISKVVASLPPEQMYEIARQMKHCVLTNPNEARNMLLQNPQLAYALLQVLVMIRAIDVSAASSILYKPNPAPVTIAPGNMGSGTGSVQPPHVMMPPAHQPPQQPPMLPTMNPNMFDPHDPFNRPPVAPQHQVFEPQRMVDPRLRQNESRQNEIFDPRVNAAPPAPSPAPLDPRIRAQNMDPRHIPGPQAPQPTRGPAPSVPPAAPTSTASLGKPSNAMFNQANFGRPVQPPNAGQPTVPANPIPSQPIDPSNPIQSEQEKANLIMQVLALSDEQIDMLPPESRESIRQLKLKLMNHGQN